MSKLNAYEKGSRKDLKAALARCKGELFTYDRTTILVCPCNDMGEKSRFVTLAVAHCSLADKFSRKRGELIALERWSDYGGIVVPRRGIKVASNEDIAIAFLNAFYSGY